MSRPGGQSPECAGCGGPLAPGDAAIRVCGTCRSPESLMRRLEDQPEPMRSTMIRVGLSCGALDPRDLPPEARGT